MKIGTDEVSNGPIQELGVCLTQIYHQVYHIGSTNKEKSASGFSVELLEKSFGNNSPFSCERGYYYTMK